MRSQNRITTPFLSEHTVSLRPGEIGEVRRSGSDEIEYVLANVEGNSNVLLPTFTVEIRQAPELYNAISQAMGSSSQQAWRSQQQGQQEQRGEQQRSRSAAAGGLTL